MLSILLVASIALAVVLGYKTQINTGFFCMAFAYLLGCFGLWDDYEGIDCMLAYQHHVCYFKRFTVL